MRVRQGIKFRQMDIKTAYLNAPIDEEIFLEQPEGFKQGDGDMVYKLKRSLYGLKQSGRNWYECLSHRLEQLGFHSSQHGRCLFTQKRGDHHCWAVVWVDDIVYGSTDFGRWFEADMGKQFTIGDIGSLAWFLGIAFKAEQDDLTLSTSCTYQSHKRRNSGCSTARSLLLPYQRNVHSTKTTSQKTVQRMLLR